MSKPYDYDAQIKRLTENPENIYGEWVGGTGLFAYCGDKSLNPRIGCLTMIRDGSLRVAATPELTEAIRADKRIPADATKIRPEHLPVFKEWQERIDAEGIPRR